MTPINAYHSFGLQYHAWGANVGALGNGKGPAHSWKRWQHDRQSLDDVNALPWANAAGVGYFPGVGGWHDIDIDHCPTFEPVRKVLQALGLPVDYPWAFRTGSGKGWRVVIICHDDIPQGALPVSGKESGVRVGWPITPGDFDHIEVRWRDCHSILPESKHPDGPGYHWQNGMPTQPPAEVSIGHVLAAYFAIATPINPTAKQADKPNPKRQAPQVDAGTDRINERAIKERFDMLAYARANFAGEIVKEKGDESRVLGNGGLLINGDEWYCHRDQIGGDAIELVGYKLFGATFDHSNAAQYAAALQEAAGFAGVTLIDTRPQNATRDDPTMPAMPDDWHTIESTAGRATETYSARVTASNRPTSAEYIGALGALGYSFRLNELTQEIEVNGAALTDNLAAELRAKMRDAGYKGMGAIADCYTAHAMQHSYHPVKDYLNGLQWDGNDHIGLLAAHFEDTHALLDNGMTWAHAALRRWLIGSVGKVFDGVQLPMLNVEGPQGLGKSRFVRWLASPLPAYFVEGPINPDDRDCKVRLMSRWLWEVSELGATTRRADIEALKAFISLRDVTVRLPYGRRDVRGPAVCALIGTLNDTGAGFLNDTTGNRRALTVSLARLDWSYSNAVDVDQVWAQALALLQGGESPYLTPEETRTQAKINAEFEAVDPVEDVLLTQFEINPQQFNWVTASADVLLVVDNHLKGTSAQHSRSIAAALKKHGVEAARPYIDGVQVRGYRGIRPRSMAEITRLKEKALQDGKTAQGA